MQLTQRKTLYIAIGSAVMAIILTSSYLAGKRRELLSWSDPITVMVATRDMLENVQIDETMVREEYVPKKFVQPGAIPRLEDAIGEVTIAPVRRGEQLTDTKLVRFGAASGLSAKVPKGRRAVAVAVNDITGVAGLIRPNNLVDVMVTFDFGNDASSKAYTYTILEASPVIAVGEDIGAGNMVRGREKREDKGLFGGAGLQPIADLTKKMTVTLALTPADAQKLTLAQETGTITLSVRPQWESDKPLKIEPATPASVTGMQELIRSRNRPAYREYRGK